MRRRKTIPRVTAVEVIGDFALRLTFDDGVVREIDFSGELWGEVFEPLRDPEYFARVRVDPVTGTIAWPNGVDFDPVALHNRPGSLAQTA